MRNERAFSQKKLKKPKELTWKEFYLKDEWTIIINETYQEKTLSVVNLKLSPGCSISNFLKIFKTKRTYYSGQSLEYNIERFSIPSNVNYTWNPHNVIGDSGLINKSTLIFSL